MPELNRSEFIELLNRLGAEDDGEALNAARTLHLHVSGAGLSWDDLLCPETVEPEASEPEALEAASQVEPAPSVAVWDEADAEPGEPAAEPDDAVEGPGLPIPADKSEDGRILDRLLARRTLSKTMREEVRDLKQAHAQGGLDAMDRRYIRALAKRLGA